MSAPGRILRGGAVAALIAPLLFGCGGARAPSSSAAEKRSSKDVVAGVDLTPVEMRRTGPTLRGTMMAPRGIARFPAVVFVHGSGRVDRDGNVPGEPGPSTYRLLAEALAARGIASVRWDKRGYGASDDVTPEERTVDHLAADVVAWRDELRADRRVCAVTLLGHSEGSDIAMMALQQTDADALANLAGSGRPMRTVMLEQVRGQVDAVTYEAFARALERVGRGEPPGELPEALAHVFSPRALPWIRSGLDKDPAALAKGVAVPMTIIQGDTDCQVSVDDDARRLAAANPRAKLVVLHEVNHLLKHEPKPSLPQTSYDTPDVPLGPGVVDAVAGAVAPCR